MEIHYDGDSCRVEDRRNLVKIQTGTFSHSKIDEFEPGFERHDYWKLIGPGIVLERRFVKHGRFEYDVPGPRKYDGGVDV
jgi:hypothetical protein